MDLSISLHNNKGATVLPYTADKIEEIYEIRKSLELLCLDISTPLMSMHELLGIKRDLLENFQSEDEEFLAHLDARLHTYIVNFTQKIRLISMMNMLFHLLQKLRYPGFRQKASREMAISEHVEILDELCLRNTSNAKVLMKKHFKNSKIIALTHSFKTR